MQVKVWSRSICGILYFKLNGIDAINEFIIKFKFRIPQA
jgi:hypothetical protein